MGEFIDFSYVKQQADFEPVLAHYGIECTGRGEERKALCPFHEETKASFKVSLDKKAFNCFGCGEHGNVLEFVAKMEDCDLREAAAKLADVCGVALSERAAKPNGETKRAQKARERRKQPSRGSPRRKREDGRQ